MQSRLIKVLQKSFIALEINDALGEFCRLCICFAIISDKLADGFNLICEYSLIHWQAQAMFSRIELGTKLPLL